MFRAVKEDVNYGTTSLWVGNGGPTVIVSIHTWDSSERVSLSEEKVVELRDALNNWLERRSNAKV